MKKVLLYILLFVLLTIVVFFVFIFVVPLPFLGSSQLGGQASSFLNDNPLLIPSVSVVAWAAIMLYIFIRNKYSDLSFGNIASGERFKIIGLGGLSMLLLKTAMQPTMWIVNNEVSESHYSIIQLWMHNDVLVLLLLALIHLTLEVVFYSAILRELILWSKRPLVSVLIVAVLCTLPGIIDVSGSATVPVICTFVTLAYGGWLYYRTCSIWPMLAGMVAYDVLLLFTPLFKCFVFVIAAALVLPWVVLYLAKKMAGSIKPLISK